nr:helix-turn-helix domain-containing protein [Haloechinothrix aidingensis]
MSDAYPALEGSATAAQQAALAAGAAAPGTATLVRHDSAVLPVLIASAPDAAHRLALRVLGPVLVLDTADRDSLLTTFRAWAVADGSAVRAAGELHCHPNTVRYRLKRLEQLTGRALSTPLDSMHLLLAARALDVLPGVEAV